MLYIICPSFTTLWGSVHSECVSSLGRPLRYLQGNYIMPMTELEQLRIQLDQLVAEINELMEFRSILEDQIAVMAADASGNTNWTSANEDGVRNYLPFLDIYEEWTRGGTRAQRVFANIKGNRHGGGNLLTNGYVVALVEEENDNLMEEYSDVQSRLFGTAILGKTFQLAVIDRDGVPNGHVRMPWWVNHTPFMARERFEEEYAPSTLRDKLTSEAERNLRIMDFYYKIASWGGNADQYLAENPGYEAP